MSLFPLCLFVGDFTCLEKEPKDFSSCVFSSGLFVVHDASWGCQNDESAKKETKSMTRRSKMARMYIYINGAAEMIQHCTTYICQDIL